MSLSMPRPDILFTVKKKKKKKKKAEEKEKDSFFWQITLPKETDSVEWS